MVSLRVRLAGLELRNPILSASGTFGHGLEMQHIVPPELVGGLVSKTVTLAPRPGNPMPRICETEAGFLNSIGLENRGVESYVEHTLPTLGGADTRIVTNVGGYGLDDFARMVERLDGEEVIDAFEINLSCPNVQGGKLPFSTDPDTAEEAIRRVRGATGRPVIAKLSPNVTRIGDIAEAVERGGADAITAVNTVLGMAVDWRRRTPGLATVKGGYSGKAIKPIALRCALECAQAVDIPVIGCGGITCAEDILEFLVVGCTAVQVGTASFGDPALLAALPAELERLLEAEGIADISELIGALDARPAAPVPAPQEAGSR